MLYDGINTLEAFTILFPQLLLFGATSYYFIKRINFDSFLLLTASLIAILSTIITLLLVPGPFYMGFVGFSQSEIIRFASILNFFSAVFIAFGLILIIPKVLKSGVKNG